MGKMICENKKAHFEYFIEDTYTCGIVLEGAEVKSIREGNVNITDGFCQIENGEVIIKNMHIALFTKAGAFNNQNSKRDRKLLLHKYEIHKIVGKLNEKGYTLIPLKMYFEQQLIKVEVGLCKGKHTFDKKQSLKNKDISRSMDREIKNYV